MERRTNNIDRVGVHLFALAVERDLKWIFREKTVSDFGIDAEIEEVKEENPTGKLIEVQIKTGFGNVSINKEGNFDFYFNQVHFDYWLASNLPVIIVLCDPEANNIYWSSISERYISKTQKGRYKITIKKNNILSSESISKLENLIKGYSQKIYYEKDYVNSFDLSNSENVNELIEYAAELLLETANSIKSSRIIIEEAHNSFEVQFDRLRNFIDKNKEGTEQKIIDKEIREVSGQFSLALNIFSQKLKDEIKITSQTHTQAIQLTTYLFSSIKNKDEFEYLIDELSEEINAISNLIGTINQLSGYYKNDTTKLSFEYTMAQNNCADILDYYSQELNDLISMIKGAIKIIKHK